MNEERNLVKKISTKFSAYQSKRECTLKEDANYKIQINEMKDELKSWISQEIDEDLTTMSDRELIWFLKGADYDFENAKKLILSNQNLKQLRPNIFKNRDPLDPDIRAVWNVVYIMKMPLKPNCRCVVYIGLKNTEPCLLDFINTEKLYHMCMDFLVQNGDLHESDFILILDGNGISSRHFSLHNLPQMKYSLQFAQHGIPLTMCEIHVINTSLALRNIFFLAKPFIEKELLKKLKFYGRNHRLFEVIPKNILPYELGGTYGSFDQIQDLTRESLERFRNWFVEEASDSRRIVFDAK